MSGYFEIGVFHPKHETNIGTLWRSAYQLGANGIFTIGKRYKRQTSDTVNYLAQLAVKEYTSFEEFYRTIPSEVQLVAIELGGSELVHFSHPSQAIYLLGAEDHGLPQTILDRCQLQVSIPSIREASLNVAVAGSIVMYDRMAKGR